MTPQEKLIEIAMGEVGYLEKASNKNLDDKTANAGSNNYTKYARDLYPSLQGQAYCDMFVDYCFVKAFGKENARKLLGGFSAYTPTSAKYFQERGQWHKTPKVGDQIFFKNSVRICHTGIVYKVDSQYVYTIEGNTSGASDVVPNGGGVCKKHYGLGMTTIAGYGRPDYSIVDDKPHYVPNAWYNTNGRWWYADSETTWLHDTWKDINHHRYYFDSEGYAVTGWQTIDGNKYFFENEPGHSLECALYVTDENGVQTHKVI